MLRYGADFSSKIKLLKGLELPLMYSGAARQAIPDPRHFLGTGVPSSQR